MLAHVASNCLPCYAMLVSLFARNKLLPQRLPLSARLQQRAWKCELRPLAQGVAMPLSPVTRTGKTVHPARKSACRLRTLDAISVLGRRCGSRTCSGKPTGMPGQLHNHQILAHPIFVFS